MYARMTRSQFLRVLKKYNASLDTDNEDYDLNIDAPKGYYFADGCHVIVEPFSNSDGVSWKAEAYAKAACRVKKGLLACDDPECDECRWKN